MTDLTVENTSEDIILTDICSKSNKKITYNRLRDIQEPVVIKTANITSWNILDDLSSLIKDIFLPRGYPDSVSKDYLEYQIWDTCQTFCSSISNTLTMRAIMQGIGVGLNTATPASAAITWIMKDGTGMVGSILFAWLKGSKLDSDCKKWRLFADILNDLAMIIELYIPFVMDYSLYMLCAATVFKALVGTAGSSTRAALITHQAVKGNTADVSAKDGSQEIFTNLFAFIFGIFLLKNVTETDQVWTVMCTATLFHLIFNYKAVKCLEMNVFNSERFCLSLLTYLPTSSVPSVGQANKKESVFLFKGIRDSYICGFSIKFGVSLKKAIEIQKMPASLFSTLTTLFQYEKYFIMPYVKKNKLYVTFRQRFTENDVLKAYFHASLIAICLVCLQKEKKLHVLSRRRKNSPIYRLQNILTSFDVASNVNREKEIITQAYMTCEDFVDKEFLAFCKACEEQGWSTEKHLINIDDWRADWPFVEEKKAKVEKLHARNKLPPSASHQRPSQQPRPSQQQPRPTQQQPRPQSPDKSSQNRAMNSLIIS